MLAALQLTNAFRVVIAAEDVTRGKPHPEGYRTAAQRLSVDPSRCLVFEDSWAGITAAKQLGCMVVAIGTRTNRRRINPRRMQWLIRSSR